MADNMDKNNGGDIPNRYGITPQWTTYKPMFLIWNDMKQIDELIKKLPHMIHYIEQWACVSFLVQQKEELAKIVLTFEEIIMKKGN